MNAPAPLTFRDIVDMLLLAAVWGGSFLFLRVAAPVVGPVAVAACRMTVAALVLLPLLLWNRQATSLRPFLGALLVSGLLSAVLPFLALSRAAQGLPAGMMSVLNATTPLWGALVGWCWAGEKMGLARLAGLLLGLAGVGLLTLQRDAFQGDVAHSAVVLVLLATLLYALSVHHARRHLHGLSPMAVTAGSMGMGSLVLLGPALWLGPQPVASSPTLAGWVDVGLPVWGALAGLALVCTAWAYGLFYRLIGRIGPSRSLTVTFLIPVFGMLWGTLFLGERISVAMVAATGVIVAGTWLSNQGGSWPFNRGRKGPGGCAA